MTTSASDTSDAFQGAQFSVQRVSSYADLVDSSEQLAQSVILELNLDEDPDELLSRVSTEVVPETVLLKLSVVDTDPGRAQAIAQSYAENLTELVRTLETPPGQSVPPIKVSIVDPASESSQPVSPQPLRAIALGLAVGLLVGVAVALVRELLDTTITAPNDIEESINTPLLGVIAYDPDARAQPLVTALDSHAPRVESFRVLRTNLQFVDVDTQEKIFVITSALSEEGKTTTAVNLAITLSQAGVRTLLLECDLRRPKAHLALGMDNALGITTVLVGRLSFQEAVQKHPETDLHFLASGSIPPNPAELLQSHAMADLLESARAAYDVVVIDAPPLLPVTDGALLAAQADGALLVVRHGKTTREQVKTAEGRLSQVDARLVGCVLNMVPSRALKDGYGYGYGYAPENSRRER